jgi:hypothetical protein
LVLTITQLAGLAILAFTADVRQQKISQVLQGDSNFCECSAFSGGHIVGLEYEYADDLEAVRHDRKRRPPTSPFTRILLFLDKNGKVRLRLKFESFYFLESRDP